MVDIIPRSEWGARPPSRRRSMSLPVPRLWLHHSATADWGPQTLRSIQDYHMDQRGYWDIAYSWAYSPTLREFYECRGPGIEGGHTSGDNDGSHGLVVLGNYDNDRPPAHTVDDLRDFLAWHGRYGPSAFTGGHRDAPGANTRCPGNHLHALLPTINTPQEDDMSVSSWAQQAWDWAKSLRIMSDSSVPKDTVTKEELAVFLQRYDRARSSQPSGDGLKRGDTVKLT